MHTMNTYIRTMHAQRRLDNARNDCPHWDYETDGEGHACCDNVKTARREWKLAIRAAMRKSDRRRGVASC